MPLKHFSETYWKSGLVPSSKERQSLMCSSISVVGGGVDVNTSTLVFYIDILFLRPGVKQVKCKRQEGKRSNNHRGNSWIYLQTWRDHD